MNKKIIKWIIGLFCIIIFAGLNAPACDAAKAVTKSVGKGKIQTKNGSVSVSKNTKKVSLKKSGTYTITGKISGYSFVVAKKNISIKLVLGGTTISNSKTSCIYNKYPTSKLTVQGKKGKKNTITGAKTYPVPTNQKEADSDAAVCSEGDITFAGTGSITVNDISTNGEAIHSKETLTIKSGSVNAVSKRVSFHGENVYVNGGVLNLTSGDTGIKSKERVYIKGGNISVSAGDKGVHGKTGVNISGGTLSISVPKTFPTMFEDFRGIVAGSTGKNIEGSIVITAGKITVISFGDCIRASKDITITGGTFRLTSIGDDGIQAKNLLTLTGSAKFTIQAGGKKVKGEKKNIGIGIVL